MAYLNLDLSKIEQCRQLANQIARPVEGLIETHTTVAIERASLRLLGVDGAVQQEKQVVPEVNLIVSELQSRVIWAMEF